MYFWLFMNERKMSFEKVCNFNQFVITTKKVKDFKHQQHSIERKFKKGRKRSETVQFCFWSSRLMYTVQIILFVLLAAIIVSQADNLGH